MRKRSMTVYCEATDLRQGLFGQVFLFLFEVLPYLHAESIFPQWEIRSTLYGSPPDYLTIPGALDLAYIPPSGPQHRTLLSSLRSKHSRGLGNDWEEISRIWNAYFKIPDRVLRQAETYSLGDTLGVHYRGTDKQETAEDTNPITQDQYLSLITEFLSTRSNIRQIFVATDEFPFVEKLRLAFSLPVLNLGEVAFHKAETSDISPRDKADRAMLDCLLLARCAVVLETSSALPSFAKVFNPSLEIYRCAASKFFADVPYFPVAYIPWIPLTSPEAQQILRATMADDWTTNPEAQGFNRSFSHVRRRHISNRFGMIQNLLKKIRD